MFYKIALVAVLLVMASAIELTEASAADETSGDRMIAAYFRSETQKLAEACLADVKTWEVWESRREAYRQQLCEMLGLEPLPERTPLRAVVTGKLEHPEFTVEKIHFQSRPQLYVTGNLYVPKNLYGPAPGILYVCGHGQAKKNGVSYGNKVKYQHHGAWFARNGYVCLVIDTVQLGEIEGVHHGTYRFDQWWWNARGYTPAGVETWNSIRALDYLESRAEVDRDRLGVTGRSGGGAYSWFVAALDDRVKVAVPVAGITSLKNHVVDGCVEGHCDCMYVVNTYRWDYPQLAALAAPRPLLIANSDQDHIFPLNGVMEVYQRVRRLYEMNGHLERLGLHITHGPHKDSQVLQLHAFEWFNRHFKNDELPIAILAEPLFEWEELKVFDSLPMDEINTRVEEVFVPATPEPMVPQSPDAWQSQREDWMRVLREKCFGGWPNTDEAQSPPTRLACEAKREEIWLRAYDFDSQEHIKLRLYLLLPKEAKLAELEPTVLHPLDEEGWTRFLSAMQTVFADELAEEGESERDEAEYRRLEWIVKSGRGLAFVAPRGIGRAAWSDDPKKERHIRRRFMLLGQTLDGMRVWDVRRAVQALRAIDGMANVPLWVSAENDMAVNALYATLFEPAIERLELRRLPKSHRDGVDYLNVLRFLDIPQAVAMVAENTRLRIKGRKAGEWTYPIAVAEELDWDNMIEVGDEGVAAGQ